MRSQILKLFRKYGGQAYMIDEPVTQMQHAVDTARYLACSARINWHPRTPASPELLLAGLLHDIGHFTRLPIAPSKTKTDYKHEEAGARLLQLYGFPPTVYQPIALHVSAKRARLHENPSLIDKLSRGSRLSLDLQGGPMLEAEYLAFRLSPFFHDAMWLREADDATKDIPPRPDEQVWREFQAKFHTLFDLVEAYCNKK